MSASHQYISVVSHGCSLRVLVAGSGPALLLVHGFPDTHQVWRKQIDVLVAAGYQVIAPDTRGCGQSDIPLRVSDYKLSVLIDDLRHVLDALNLKTVGLIGHDWGAVIAWNFLMAHPERVSQYLALSVGHPLSYATGGIAQKLRGWYALAFMIVGLAEWVLLAFGGKGVKALSDNHPETQHWIPQLSKKGRMTAGLNYYRANVISLLARRKYPQIKRPVKGVWSTGDKFLTETQMTLSASLCPAGWNYERMEQASHWLQLDKPEEINRIILDYFDHN